MFADDTSVFIEDQSCGNVCQLLNEELEKCDIWIKANKLTLNLKKTHFMIFNRSRIKSEGVQIRNEIRNENIKETNSIKFLGIIVDNKLKWHEHLYAYKDLCGLHVGFSE